jgi:hypothetical protein
MNETSPLLSVGSKSYKLQEKRIFCVSISDEEKKGSFTSGPGRGAGVQADGEGVQGSDEVHRQDPARSRALRHLQNHSSQVQYYKAFYSRNLRMFMIYNCSSFTKVCNLQMFIIY